MCELCCFVILLPQLAQDTEIRLLTHSQCTIYRQEKSFPEKFSLESYFRCFGDNFVKKWHKPVNSCIIYVFNNVRPLISPTIISCGKSCFLPCTCTSIILILTLRIGTYGKKISLLYDFSSSDLYSFLIDKNIRIYLYWLKIIRYTISTSYILNSLSVP